MKEIWKNIKGYEGIYQISNLGNVRNLLSYERKNLKGEITEKGYIRVSLHKNGFRKVFRVHRLVAQAFIPNPLNKPQINHKDGNKLNNCVDNLEWATNKENIKHAIQNKLRAKEIRHVKPIAYIKNGTIIKRYPSISSAAKETSFSREHICHQLLISKNNKKRKNVEWIYI